MSPMPVRVATRPPADERLPAAPEAIADDLRTRVTVARTNREDYGQRQVFVRLDEGERIALLYNESHTLELLPGRHRLRAHNTLMWRTIDFTVEMGEHLEFQFINRANWFTLTMLMWLGSGPLYLKVLKRSLA